MQGLVDARVVTPRLVGVHVEGRADGGAQLVEAGDVVGMGMGEEHHAERCTLRGREDLVDLRDRIDDGAPVRGLVDKDEGVVGPRAQRTELEDA